jgi:uncharacterized membrane-anchored protein
MGRAIHGLTSVVLGLAAHAGDLTAQDSAAMARFDAIPWEAGPTDGALSEARVRVPEGCRFAEAAGTREFLEFTENPVSGNERGVMLCRGEGEQRSWFVIFTFDDIGLVKDEEKDELDAARSWPRCVRVTTRGTRSAWSEGGRRSPSTAGSANRTTMRGPTT